MSQTPPTTNNAQLASNASRDEAAFERSIAPPVPAVRPNPLSAWRLHARFGPVANAVERLLRHGGATAGGTAPRRVLAFGRKSSALDAILVQSMSVNEGQSSPVEIQWIDAPAELPLPFEDAAFDAVVAIDALPLVTPSARERTVTELARVARTGVVVSSPFDGPGVAAAERAVNDLCRSARGADHPELGRHLELGLPDLSITRSWLEGVFSHVATIPVDHLHVWQSMATLELFEPSEATELDAAEAMHFPVAVSVGEGDPAYRTLVVASKRPFPVEFRSPGSGNAEFTALAMHVALEGAAQRQSLDRLFVAVTSERERERREFADTVASLAAELHEREAIGEVLLREARERELTIDHLKATVAELDRRIVDTDTHVDNLEEAMDATHVHARNLEALREEQRERADRLQSELDETRASAELTAQHVENLETMLAALRLELAAANERISEAEGRAQLAGRQYEDFASSRGGRALERYIRMKRKVLGKGEAE